MKESRPGSLFSVASTPLFSARNRVGVGARHGCSVGIGVGVGGRGSVRGYEGVVNVCQAYVDEVVREDAIVAKCWNKGEKQIRLKWILPIRNVNDSNNTTECGIRSFPRFC